MIYRAYYSMSDLLGEAAQTPAYAESRQLTFQAIFSPVFDSISGLETNESKTLLQKYIWPRFYDENIFYVDVEALPWEEPQEPMDLMATREGKAIAGRIISWLRETTDTYGELAKLYESQKTHLLDQIKITANTKSTSINANNNTTESTSSGTSSLQSEGTNNATRTPNLTNTTTSTSTQKSNDTPQIVEDLASDNYASRVNTTENSSTVKDTGSETNNTTSTGKDIGSTSGTATVSSSGGSNDTNESETTTSTDRDTMINRLDDIRQKLVSVYGKWADSFREFVIYD